MQITPRERLLHYADLLQGTLFGLLETERVHYREKHAADGSARNGSTEPANTLCARLARASRQRPAGTGSCFRGQSVYGLGTTRQLLQRLRSDRQLRCLCGWTTARQIPHESTFSRAFQEFAETELPQRLHGALIVQTQAGRLVGHIARDSTAIEAHERALSGRRLPRQRRQTLPEMLSELPRHCSLGVKKSGSGHQQYWRGYKLHLDVADGQIPISCLLTAAALHDSQGAIPLATMSAQRVISLYDLVDCAYDANEIQAHSRSLGHVPLIAPHGSVPPIPERMQASLRRYHKRRKVPKRYDRKRLPFTPAEEQRLAEPTMVERVYSRLKDEFGAPIVRVRGASKIMAHLMFGVIALTVDQLLKLTG